MRLPRAPGWDGTRVSPYIRIFTNLPWILFLVGYIGGAQGNRLNHYLLRADQVMDQAIQIMIVRVDGCVIERAIICKKIYENVLLCVMCCPIGMYWGSILFRSAWDIVQRYCHMRYRWRDLLGPMPT